MQVQILSGVPSTEGGSDGRARTGSRVISRFNSCSVYQISGCGAVGARQFGELEVVGSIPTTQTISFGS